MDQQRGHDKLLVRMKQDNAMRMREGVLERYRLMQQVEELSGGVASDPHNIVVFIFIYLYLFI